MLDGRDLSHEFVASPAVFVMLVVYESPLFESFSAERKTPYNLRTKAILKELRDLPIEEDRF